MMRSAVALLALTLLFSGCFGSGTKTDPDGKEGDLSSPVDVWETVGKLLAGVPCEVSSIDQKTSANLKQLSKVAFDGKTHGEIDIRGDLAVVARYSTGGFEVINISNPANAAKVGEFTEAKGALDVKFSPDNQTVLVGEGEGIVLADVRDPTDPVKVGEWKFPAGLALFQNAHMFSTARIANQDWVFLAPNSNTGIWILKLEGPPEARKLTYVTQTLPVEGGPLGPHDLYVALDEDLKKWLLYSSDGYHGWLVFDVSDPSKPTPVGGFVNPETGYTHTIQAAKIGGKRIVATIAEVGVNFLKVYDATNLAAPILLGVWDAGPQYAANPEHNFNIVAGKLYLAYYTLGVYVFDLTKVTTPIAGTVDLKPMAHFAGDASPGVGALAFGNFWDVVLKDGILYMNDVGKGLYVAGFGCNKPGDAALTSTG